jgi:hypothetical protein
MLFETISQTMAFAACLALIILSPTFLPFNLQIPTFAQVDNQPPEIIDTTPDPGAMQVSVYVPIQGFFNDQIADGFEENILVTDESGKLVSGRVLFTNSQEFLFIPEIDSIQVDLAFDQTYTVTVKAGIPDLAGNAMPSDFSWSFTTKTEKEASKIIKERAGFANAHANWRETDTEADLIASLDLDVIESAKNEIGTSIVLHYSVRDSQGVSSIEADGFFETTADVFDYSPKLSKATLKVQMPVTVCIDSAECTSETWMVESKWSGIGKIKKTVDDFAITENALFGEEKVKRASESLFRAAQAQITVNDLIFDSSANSPGVTFINSNTQSLTRFGDTHLVGASPISIPECPGKIVDKGNKLVSDGKGRAAAAAWIVENNDGTSTGFELGVGQGGFSIGRQCFFSEGTNIFLLRTENDNDGNVIGFDSGMIRIEPSEENPFKLDKKLKSAELSAVEIPICSEQERDAQGNCIEEEMVTISAVWTGIGKISTEHFTFNALTNCDDAECSTIDQEPNFRVKIVSDTQNRIAVATAVINGIETGENVPSLTEGESAGFGINERLIVQNSDIYPFNIFPIQIFDQ